MTTNEAVVRLGLDTTSFQSGMQNFRQKFTRGLKSMVSEWGALLGTGALLGGLNQLMNKFDDLSDTAENLGLSTDFLQGMSQIASKDAVGGVKSFDKAISELSVKLGAAKSGSEEALKSFAKWGISLDDIAKKDTQEVFYQIASIIEKIPDPAIRTAAAFELMGKSGKNLTGILAAGAPELQRLVETVEKVTSEQVKLLADSKAKLQDAGNQLQIFAAGLLEAGKAFQHLTAITSGDKTWGDWSDELLKQINLETQRAVIKLKARKAEADAIKDAAQGRASEEALKKQLKDLKELTNQKLKDLEQVRRAEQMAGEAEASRLKKLAALRRELRSKTSSENVPTLEELANAGRWVNGQWQVSPYAQTAQDLLGFKDSARIDRAFGINDPYYRSDLQGIRDTSSKLEMVGLYEDPNKSVVEAIEKLSAPLKSGGLPVKITNAD